MKNETMKEVKRAREREVDSTEGTWPTGARAVEGRTTAGDDVYTQK